jgi:cell division protein FtsB
LSKVATTYWDNISLPRVSSRPKMRTQMKSKRESATPQWFVFTVVVSITFMLCLTINMRAFTELNSEVELNQRLNVDVDRMTNENLALQEEIHNLKTDSNTIEREARKLGMSRSGEKVLVPAN